MTTPKRFSASQERRETILIRTRHPGGTAFQGIVLVVAPSFLIIHEITDFEANGILVIPKKWIKDVRVRKHERLIDNVIHHNGSIQEIGTELWWSDLHSLEEIMQYLKEKDTWPAVEVVYANQASLYLGPVIEVSRDTATLSCYDAAGEWEKNYELESARSSRSKSTANTRGISVTI